MSWKLSLAALALAGLLGAVWLIKWQTGKIEDLAGRFAAVEAANKALQESNNKLAQASERTEKAVVARDEKVEQIEREYTDLKARVEAAMQSDPDAQDWGRTPIPDSVLRLLRAAGSDPDASDHSAPTPHIDAGLP